MHRKRKPRLRVQNVLFKQQKSGIQQSPQNKIPRCPVPEAGGCPYDKDIENMAYRLYAVSSEGNIKIITKPTAQRNVPTAPKLRNAC